MNSQFTTDIKELAAKIKDNWTLCNFLGKSEKEYMVAETIHAARLNLQSYGEAFSIKGNIRDGRYGLFENRSSYASLVEDGLFREEERNLPEHGVVTVIFPTPLLIEKLRQFFKQKG